MLGITKSIVWPHYTIGMAEDATYRFWQKKDETAEHILCDCQA